MSGMRQCTTLSCGEGGEGGGGTVEYQHSAPAQHLLLYMLYTKTHCKTDFFYTFSIYFLFCDLCNISETCLILTRRRIRISHIKNCDFKRLPCREKAPVSASLCLCEVGEVSQRAQKGKTTAPPVGCMSETPTSCFLFTLPPNTLYCNVMHCYYN